MSHIVWSVEARADLDDIWLFIAQDSLDAADRVIDRITDAARPLADYPLMGIVRPELAADLRAVVSGSYVIFYRPRSGGVRIDRVLHGRRDITPDDF